MCCLYSGYRSYFSQELSTCYFLYLKFLPYIHKSQMFFIVYISAEFKLLQGVFPGASHKYDDLTPISAIYFQSSLLFPKSSYIVFLLREELLTVLLVIEFLSFCLFKEAFFSSPFLKNNFTRYRILGEQGFFLSIL